MMHVDDHRTLDGAQADEVATRSAEQRNGDPVTVVRLNSGKVAQFAWILVRLVQTTFIDLAADSSQIIPATSTEGRDCCGI